MLRGRDVHLLDGARAVNEWKKDLIRPAADPTVYIPRMQNVQKAETRLLPLPTWIGKAVLSTLLALIYLVACYLLVVIFMILNA